MNKFILFISIRYWLVASFLILLVLNVQAQESGLVKGTVSARNDGTSVPGVSVTNLTTSQTVATDLNGKYSIKAASGSKLKFSYIGFAPQEVIVTSSSLNVSLNPITNDLDQVVVVGYGTSTRRNLTTSVAKIDVKDVPQSANSSVAQLVFGRAAGVQAVQQSAEPGGNISISIRGRGEPLIVIDGVVMPYSGIEPGNSGVANELNGVKRGGFAGINPQDIESMEFLKDASAAVYGVGAANGVVLITTKKGKAGRLAVNYDGVRSAVVNQKYLEPLTASEYMSYYNQLTREKDLFDKNMVPYGTVIPGAFTPKYSATDIANAGEGTDWLDEVLQNGSVDNHNLTITGGADKISYYVSGGYFGQDGTVKRSGMDRYTGRANLTFNFTKWLKLNTSLAGSRGYFLNSTAGWQTGNSGSQGFGSLQAALAYPRNVPVYDNTGKYSLFQVTGNPVSLLDIQDRTDLNTLNATISADFNIIGDEFKARLLYGNNYESSTRNFFVPSTTYYFQLNKARGSRNFATRELQTMEAMLMYNKKIFNKAINVDLLGVIGEYPVESYGFGASSQNMLDGLGTDNLFAGNEAVTVSSYRNKEKKRSYLAKASFDVLDKYLFQFTGRYDGYSQFFPSNKFNFFPSASVAWKISSEKFMEGLSFLDLLKVRASYGITGLATGFAYASYGPGNSLISFNSGSLQQIPYTLYQLDQPALRWPKTENKNIGLDFGLFKNRITGSFDWFRDDLTRNIDNLAPTAPLSLFGTQPVNGAHYVRQGWEANLSSNNINTNNFSWRTTINLSHVDYSWKERFAHTGLTPGVQATDPVNSIYVFKTNGIIQPGEVLTAAQKTLPPRGQLPGNPRILDLDGDGKLNANDIVRLDGSPKLTLGFGNNFTYKQFDFSFFVYGAVGAYGLNNYRAWATPANFVAGTQSGIKDIGEVWSTSNPGGSIPGVAFDQASLGLPTGLDVDYQKTDFIRVRNINLGYTFNQESIKKYVKNLKIFVDVQNPLIFTNYKIADPEVQTVAVKGGPAPYPMATTYSFGVRAGF